MEDLGSEVSQLGSLFEVKLVNRLRLVNDTRVVIVHTVDIRPDLDLLSIDGSTYERGGIVGTTTQQVVHFAIGIAADESLGDVYLSTLVLLDQWLQLLLDVDGIGLGILVCTHEVERVQQHGVDALLLHVVHNHVGRDDLALSHDALLLKRGEQLLGERTEIVELPTQELAGSSLRLFLLIQLLNVLGVFLLQTVDHFIRAIRILLVEIV